MSLHLYPYFIYMSREGSGESVYLCMLAQTCVAHQCDKYRNLMCWLDIILYLSALLSLNLLVVQIQKKGHYTKFMQSDIHVEE